MGRMSQAKHYALFDLNTIQKKKKDQSRSYLLTQILGFHCRLHR